MFWNYSRRHHTKLIDSGFFVLETSQHVSLAFVFPKHFVPSREKYMDETVEDHEERFTFRLILR
jgi:hypothetical protein